MSEPQQTPVCDYEGSDYRTRFWEDAGRSYEDQVERIALRQLLPPRGDTLIDIGAGFGRLADEYDGYRRVVLFDYSRSLLQEARERLEDDPRYCYVAGNWYQMPFVDGLFQTMVQVRTIHHAADVPELFAELARIARPGGTYVLEFANKQNLKAMLRYALRRQPWSPFSPQPVEFVELNYNFHPRWIRQHLQRATFNPQRTLTVSHFRLRLLKRLVPTRLLVRLDSVAQRTGRWWQLSPSVFVASQHPTQGKPALPDAFFACPTCRTPLQGQATLTCPGCSRQWAKRDGVYDFKEPL
ncbi:MAG TPA: class I SAM-dependent methyltransferase [Candidatus Sulfomarinibacteraceae bacterium]|nr:class I SAM-dependent methyltransferase [Candidatus Sulfomarinibacteraceae bacterium]